MPAWDVATGTRGAVLRLTVNILSSNAAARTHEVQLRLEVIGVPSATFFNDPKSCSISGTGIDTISTSFTWASGTTSKVLIDTVRTVSANANGTLSGSYTASIGATGTTGVGGPTTNGPRGVSFPTLTVPPNTPTGCSAARVSDTSVTVSWSQSHPSNGAATSNTIRRRVNGGAFTNVATISPANSASLGAAANQKLEFGVLASNGAGSSGWSNTSAPIYTSPAAPTNVVAAKDAALDITVSWTPNVAFVEHQHQVEFSTNGGSTWSTLATVAAGTLSYKHVSPNPAFAHLYRVRARNTAAGNLTSAWVQSNTVQLLAPPNAPTLANLPNFVDRTVDLPVNWTHNPVDTTPQTAYEVQFSTNGGSSWSSTGKVTSSTSQRVVAANTYAADVALTVRVRTWGQATSGGADGTGASLWSTTDTVVFKSRPVATILAPANGSTWDRAELNVGLGFSQAQGATFVQATIELSQGATVLESVQSTTLASTILDTSAIDGGTYTITVTVLDSNGLTSSQVTSTFTVDFTEPVAAVVSAEYLEDSGIVQLSVTVPAPSGGAVAAVSLGIDRTINGARESLFASFPIAAGSYTFLDTTPTIKGANVYRVRTFSADGARAEAPLVTVETDEQAWAFMNSGPGFDRIIRFKRRLVLASAPGRTSTLVATAGRRAPIALFGENTELLLRGSSTVLDDDVRQQLTDGGSSIAEIEQFILTAGRICYRDPSGRRVFGRVEGSFINRAGATAEFVYSVTEAS